tara:strand:+ start:299 stop:508 length:210 start_codon:yes stop_codon:yes gene_type:complete
MKNCSRRGWDKLKHYNGKYSGGKPHLQKVISQKQVLHLEKEGTVYEPELWQENFRCTHPQHTKYLISLM